MQGKFTSQDVNVLEREILYKGVFTLYRFHLRIKLFDGQWSEPFTREVLERKPAVAILPYDPILDKVVLIEQFRPGALNNKPAPWLIEIVAGIIDDSSSPDVVAKREAQEEAGCIITEIIPIQHLYVSPGGSTEELFIFCGKVDAKNIDGIYGLDHEQENIRAFTLSVDEALNKLHNHDIKTAPAIIALQWLQINHLTMRTKWQDPL